VILPPSKAIEVFVCPPTFIIPCVEIPALDASVFAPDFFTSFFGLGSIRSGSSIFCSFQTTNDAAFLLRDRGLLSGDSGRNLVCGGGRSKQDKKLAGKVLTKSLLRFALAEYAYLAQVLLLPSTEECRPIPAHHRVIL